MRAGGRRAHAARSRRRVAAGAVAAVAALSACLPGDTRPPPGSLLVTVSPGPALESATVAAPSEDGWVIGVDRFLIAVGRVILEGDACAIYSLSTYDRVFDMRMGGTQKVSEQYALGACDFSFRVVTPSANSLLGVGVSEADVQFMRTPGTTPEEVRRGVSVLVIGQAQRGASVKRFAWDFRPRIVYERCRVESGTGAVFGVDARGGEAQTIDLVIHGDAPFRDAAEPSVARVRFDAFALADDVYGDADGEVTLEELAAVPIEDARASGGYADVVPAGLDGGAPPLDSLDGGVPPITTVDAGVSPAALLPVTTLRDFVILRALPQVAQFRGDGRCDVEVRLNPINEDDFDD